MKRLLVANDLMSGAANVMARAILLAAQSGAELRIVHAAESDDPEDSPAGHRGILAEARIMAEELTALPLDIDLVIAGGSPGHAILEAADKFAPELVILGGHGTPRFRDALFGTTGTQVARHCRFPLLVVQQDAFLPYRVILIAVEDSVAATPIVALAQEIAPRGELFAVHAVNPSLRQVWRAAAKTDHEERRVRAELEAMLGAAASRAPVPPGAADAHVIVRAGEAMSIIMEETERLKPDLFVMGTHQRRRLAGSHAVDTLFWCPHDILIVPDTEMAAVGTSGLRAA